MNETLREALATLKYGIVDEVHPQRHRVKVRIPDLDDMVTHWLPVLVAGRTMNDKDYSLPEKDEQVALLLDGRGEEGIVLGTIFSDADPPPENASEDLWHKSFQDGTRLEYDRASHVLKVDAKGLTGGLNIQVEGNVHLKGGLFVTLEALGQLTLRAPLIGLDAPLVNITGVPLPTTPPPPTPPPPGEPPV